MVVCRLVTALHSGSLTAVSLERSAPRRVAEQPLERETLALVLLIPQPYVPAPHNHPVPVRPTVE